MNPPYIYLDTNHWIYLAKDYWGKPHKSSHKGFASKLLNAIRLDKVRLPISIIHCIEHLRAESADRRQRLAEVMDLFSGGWFIASWPQILPVEIHRAVFQTFELASLAPVLEVFGKGFLFGLGNDVKGKLTDSQVWSLQNMATAPGIIFDMLTFPNEHNRKLQNTEVTRLGEESAKLAEDLRKLRKPYPLEMHRRGQYGQYILNHQEKVFLALSEIGRSVNDFRALGVTGLSKFWSDVPSLDVDCELTLYRDRQWSRTVDSNDLRDLGHLAVAVPYCDVVVTERFWVKALKETGLAKKYSTVVYSDLSDLLHMV